MRVIECNNCGDAISAASDEELAGRLAVHMRDEHDEEADPAELEELLADEAYEALDS